MKTDEKNPHKRILALEQKIAQQRSELKSRQLRVIELERRVNFYSKEGDRLGFGKECVEFVKISNKAARLEEEAIRLREALEEMRLRALFVGHPGEAFHDRGDGVMVPDWRDALAKCEAALNPTAQSKPKSTHPSSASTAPDQSEPE